MNKTEFKKIVGEILKSHSFAYENKYYTFENTDLLAFKNLTLRTLSISITAF